MAVSLLGRSSQVVCSLDVASSLCTSLGTGLFGCFVFRTCRITPFFCRNVYFMYVCVSCHGFWRRKRQKARHACVLAWVVVQTGTAVCEIGLLAIPVHLRVVSRHGRFCPLRRRVREGKKWTRRDITRSCRIRRHPDYRHPSPPRSVSNC